MHTITSVGGSFERSEHTVGDVISQLERLPHSTVVDVTISLDELKRATTPSIDFHGKAMDVKLDLMALTQRRARGWL